MAAGLFQYKGRALHISDESASGSESEDSEDLFGEGKSKKRAAKAAGPPTKRGPLGSLSPSAATAAAAPGGSGQRRSARTSAKVATAGRHIDTSTDGGEEGEHLKRSRELAA